MRVNQYNNQVNNLQKKVRNNDANLDEIINLAHLHNDGINGVNKKEEAIKQYSAAINQGYLEGYFEIAKIFHYDFEPPNIDEAIKNYCKYITHSQNEENKLMAKFKLEDISVEFPEIYHEYSAEVQESLRIGFPLKIQKKKRIETFEPTAFEFGQPETNFQPIMVWREIGTTSSDEKSRNNGQNVHDHGVQNSIQKAIEILERENKIDKSVMLQEIENYLEKNSERAKNVFKTMDDIPLSLTKKSEHDALSLVWARINRFEDPEVRNGLKKQLVNELEDCATESGTVCKTGRFNRIIDTLVGVDTEIQIKPMWAIKEEIGSKAAKIRDDYINNLDIDSKRIVTTAKELETAEENEIYNKYKKEVADKIEESIKTDYSNILEPELLDVEISKWTQID